MDRHSYTLKIYWIPSKNAGVAPLLRETTKVSGPTLDECLRKVREGVGEKGTGLRSLSVLDARKGPGRTVKGTLAAVVYPDETKPTAPRKLSDLNRGIPKSARRWSK